MAAIGHQALQKSIYEKLTEDSELLALISGVFDHVVEGAQMPYVVIGDIQSRDWSSKSTSGSQMLTTLHVFSRGYGRKQASLIMDRIYELLHKGTLTLEGFALVAMRFEFGDVLLEADGITYHGLLRFRAFMEETA